jgi:hypothetical protein
MTSDANMSSLRVDEPRALVRPEADVSPEAIPGPKAIIEKTLGKAEKISLVFMLSPSVWNISEAFARDVSRRCDLPRF